MLVKVRTPKEKDNLSDDALKGPTLEDIQNATKNLQVKNRPKPAISSDIPIDVSLLNYEII